MPNRNLRQKNSKRSPKKTLKKQKYNILVWGLIIIFAIFIVSKIAYTISNRSFNSMDSSVLIVKNDGNEVKTFTLKQIRNMDSKKKQVEVSNIEKVEIEGIPMVDFLSNIDMDSSKYVNMYLYDENGNKSYLAMENVLEPDRYYLVYRINGKPNRQYNSSFGVFAIIDTRSSSIDSWDKNIQTIDIN